jgi:hypothetical protein
MNKSSLFLACAFLAPLAFFSACSDEKKDPTHAEYCAKTPLDRNCLVGKWRLDGVYSAIDGSVSQCNEGGTLDLLNNDEYHFTGGVYRDNDWGTWALNGNNITVTVTRSESSSTGDVTEGTISLANSGGVMWVKRKEGNSSSTFSHCPVSSGLVEKYTWSGQ